ncbi:MAG: hypothetical protein CMK28_01310 [Porticoccaceae bacterium]|nr:hypothetical protein [Porticoccaceae bacterium]
MTMAQILPTHLFSYQSCRTSLARAEKTSAPMSDNLRWGGGFQSKKIIARANHIPTAVAWHEYCFCIRAEP